MIRSSLEECKRLAETAEAEVLETIMQFRERPDSAWMIGKGKAEEVAQLAEELEADLVIFDRELTPAQIKNLDRMLPCKVIDRTQLILDIFASRAFTKEGRLQVELAQLQYLLPRLTGYGSEMSRLGGGIGTRGPGEKKLETDRRHIRRQITNLKHELEKVRKHRFLHQKRRKKSEIIQVALIGYTNAGKSTLFNRLTGSEVLAENKLFATLDPTSRALELPNGEMVVITDTVGFIRNLPHQLVAAFRSTLEQVKEADLLLHVVDLSSPEAPEQIRAVEEVLYELDAADIPTLMVLNKKDLWNKEDGFLVTEPSIRISAFDSDDLERLKRELEDLLFSEELIGEITIPPKDGAYLTQILRYGEALEMDAEGADMKVRFRIASRHFKRFPKELQEKIERID